MRWAHWSDVPWNHAAVRDLAGASSCGGLSLLDAFVEEAHERDLLEAVGRYEAFLYALPYAEIGVGTGERLRGMRGGSVARVVDARPLRIAANYPSELLVFWHGVGDDVPAALTTGEFADVAPQGPGRSAATKLGGAVCDLVWLGVGPSRGFSLRSAPGGSCELLVVITGAGTAASEDEETPLRVGSFACRTDDDPELRITATADEPLHLLSYRPLPTSNVRPGAVTGAPE